MHVFGLWEEVGLPEENPHKHRENMKTPHRKTPGGNSAYYQATVLPPYCPKTLYSSRSRGTRKQNAVSSNSKIQGKISFFFSGDAT